MDLNRPTLRWLCAAVLFFCSFATFAAGTVTFASGSVRVARGTLVTLSKGDQVKVGDEIVTGVDGRVQLLMDNGDRIALRPNTRFRVDEFVPPKSQPGQERSGLSLRRIGRSVFSLLRGGFSTVTNTSLGPRDLDSYQVRTPVATIGVRGTVYSARYCASDCGAAAKASGNGLYVAVKEGNAILKNDAGTFDVTSGQFTQVRSSAEPARIMQGVPPVIEQESAPEGEADEGWQSLVPESSEEDDSQGDSVPPPSPAAQVGETPAQRIVASDGEGNLLDLTGGEAGIAETGDTGSGGSGGNGGGGGFGGGSGAGGDAGAGGSGGTTASTGSSAFAVGSVTGMRSNNSNITTDSSGDLRSFNAVRDSGSGPQQAQYSYSGGPSLSRGGNPTTGLQWGRWFGGTASETGPAGNFTINLSNQSLHWIYATVPAVLPITGTATYSLIGNTNPTDNQGHVGSLGSASLTASFNNGGGSITNGSLNVINMDGRNWNASGANGSINPDGSFSGDYSSVQINGNSCNPCSGSGEFSGFFTGGNGSAPPPGAGMTYDMSGESGAASGHEVNGAAAFGNPASGP